LKLVRKNINYFYDKVGISTVVVLAIKSATTGPASVMSSVLKHLSKNLAHQACD
jgi:hypothetical protein